MRKFTWREHTSLAWRFTTEHRRVEQFNHLDQQRIAGWQFRRVRRLVDIAYHHTELYRKKYDAAGIHPDDIRGWREFAQLPTLTKEELIEFGTRAVDDRRDPANLFTSRSSGSSGELVSIHLDARAMITQAIQAIRMIKEMQPDYGPLNRELLVYTSEYPYSSIGGLYRATYAHTLLPTRRLIEHIVRTRPTVIAVYPSVLRDIVRLRDKGDQLRHLRTIITNSEQSSQEERDFFADRLGCAVYDEFSSEELSSIAYQCAHRRYHVTQDSSYIEVLSPTSDTTLPAGRPGEIVGTCLINSAMPVIRYRQGDLASLRYANCACGRGGPVLDELVGRMNDSFWRADGTEVPAGRILDWAYALILDHELGVREFQVTQRTERHVDIDLVVEPTYDESTANQIIERSFLGDLGEGFEVAVSVVPSIPRTESGKYNPIRSLVRGKGPRWLTR